MFLAIALGVWASEFPQRWYLVPFVILYFFGQDNKAERLLEQERLPYEESRNPEALKKDQPHRKNNGRPIVTGIVFTTAGTAITFMAFGDLIFSDAVWDGDWSRVVVFLLFGALPFPWA